MRAAPPLASSPRRAIRSKRVQYVNDRVFEQRVVSGIKALPHGPCLAGSESLRREAAAPSWPTLADAQLAAGVVQEFFSSRASQDREMIKASSELQNRLSALYRIGDAGSKPALS